MHLQISYVFVANILSPIVKLALNLENVVLYQKEPIDTNYLVTGKNTWKEDWYCSDARNTEHLCGTSGKHFEKKDTLQ